MAKVAIPVGANSNRCNMIHIDRTKNLGIIFQPRSGSTVLQYYLSSVLNSVNLGESMNLFLSNSEYVQNVTRIFKEEHWAMPQLPKIVNSTFVPLIDPAQDPYIRMKCIYKINEMASTCVFKLFVNSYYRSTPEFSNYVQDGKTQFIYLSRADVLYGLISNYISAETSHYHSMDSDTAYLRVPAGTTFVFPVEDSAIQLAGYIKQCAHIDNYFPEAPRIYYEQFQFNPTAILSLFAGIPKQIISIPYNKFVGNHKDHIQNLDELEDYYEKFVNDHREYFPQYFHKLPGVNIPAIQGRQPRDLSLQKVA